MELNNYNKAAGLIRKAGHITAFTGAGISVESNIPPFRGEGGLWEKYDPGLFDISYFNMHPDKSWELLRELFYGLFGKVKPNPAHTGLALMEKNNLLHAIITQNIDNLHQEAGSRQVFDFHGNLKSLICRKCFRKSRIIDTDLAILPPQCSYCGGIIKPDIVFFGEGIPRDVYESSFRAAEEANVLLVIGTTGMVMPAAQIPAHAKAHGASIIEINTQESEHTHSQTDIFLQGKASEQILLLLEALGIRNQLNDK